MNLLTIARGAASKRIIAWSLGIVALAAIGSFSASETSEAANAACVVSKSDWNKGSRFDTLNQVGICDWTVPSGNTTVDADLVGGGGGGGISPASGSGGGGGGQVVRLRTIPVTTGALQTIVIGDGAPQVTMTDTTTGANGGTGGSTSFLGYTAAGGLGGTASVSNTIGGKGGDSYTDSTITGSGTVLTTKRLGSVAIAGNSTCTLARNGGGGASSFAAGLQTGGTSLTSSAGTDALNSNTLFNYFFSGGGGGHRDPVSSTVTSNTVVAQGGIGGGGDGGLGVFITGGTPTYALNGVNGTGGGGGGIGGTCGKHSFGVGAATTRGGSGAVVIKYLSPAPMTIPEITAWQGYNQLDWPNYLDTATTGYKVYWSTSATALSDANISTLPSTNIITITGATASSYTHSNLTIGTTYYYRVRATYSNAAAVATDGPFSVQVSGTPLLTDTIKFVSNAVGNAPKTTFAPQDFTVPSNVNMIKVNAFGASSNTTNASWGTGGSVLANLPVTPGTPLKLFIGSQPQNVNGTNIVGYNGGGTSGYGVTGYGGGATDIRIGGSALANRVIVAGGAGGRSGGYWGGPGGGLTGGLESGGQVSGGTQTGAGAPPASTVQILGTLGVGGSASNASGAGGGGYWGGNSNAGTYAGGGGSSFASTTAQNVVHTQGGNVGDGYLTLTYTAQSLVPTGVKAIPGQAQNTIAWDRTNISGANGYKVYGGTSPNPTTVLATVVGVDKTAYVHTGLSNGTTYYYRIAATVPAFTNNTGTILTGYSLEVAATPNFMATEVFKATRAKKAWTVPQGVNWIQVVAKGASANTTNASWSTGGTVTATIAVTPGEILNLYVGGQPQTVNGVNVAGFNGGGTSGYGITGYGGGGTDIRQGGDALANRVIVAGGGGGRSGGYWGGPGGGLIGGIENGSQASGGTQSGPGEQPGGTVQVFGGFGVGGSTATASGAGGGGYYGGNSNGGTYAGGGGSSYADPAAVNVIHNQGGVVGDGSLTISYPTVAYPVGVQAISGQGFNTIIWDPTLIQGATGYKVYGGTTPNPTTLLSTTAVPFGTQVYTHTGLTIGTTYYYRVTVMSGTLESQKSAEVSAVPSFTVDKTYKLTRGMQTFTVPSGVFWLRTTLKGASANTTNATWNTGGTVTGILPVTPGEVLNLYVGGRPDTINGVNTLGYNGGGGSGYGITGFGGGASDIRRGGTALADRILVAGGGGGRSGGYWGGPGGGLIGGEEAGGQTSGGTQSGPGAQPGGTVQVFGALGVGGTAVNASGGGGGGYWGGNSNGGTYAGGGGSSYTDASVVNVVHTQGGVVGDGSIMISYALNQAPQNFVAVPAANKVSLSWTASEITGLQDYQIFRRTSANGAESLLATVVAPTLVYVDSTAANGTTYYYRLVARALVNAVATATASTSDVLATPTTATTVTFAATRTAQNWVVPQGVSWVQVVAKGASANTTNASWNTGGQVTASLPVTPGETLGIYVGGQPKTVAGATVWGWNGGGTSGYGVTGGGGGATDIRRGGTLLGNRVLVAGGGGGRSGGYWGGPGGGLVGGDEAGAQTSGGTQSGPGVQPGGTAQIFGVLGVGASTANASGGGGGGYWGGNSNSGTYAGGGGSSYASPDAVNVVHTQGGNVGDGAVTITYVIDTIAPTVTGITSPAVNTKTYKAGEDIFIDVNFSESVVVTGSPTLDINAGLGGQRTIAYVSGSGTASLRFLYTVLAGDDKTNLDTWATNALSIANGANIADSAGNNAVLTLPALATASSLSSRLLVVDGIVPNAPSLIGASGGTQITIDWSDVNAADLLKYNVYVSTDGINYSQLNSVMSSVGSPISIFTQQVVARGITYYYYVTAVDIHGNESDPSVITSWSIAADGTLQTPSVQVKSPTNNLAQPITGTAVPGATVEIMDGGIVVGAVTADAVTGVYSFTPSGGSLWTVSTHSISAKASLNGVLSSPTVASSMVVDTVVPTFTSQLRFNPLSPKTASVVLVWKITFSEPMAGLDPSDFVVSGTTAVVASVTQSIGTTTSYDVRVTGGNIGSVNGPISLAFASGQNATDVAGNALAVTTPTAAAENYVLDHSYPTMTITRDKATLGASATAVITFTSSLDAVVGEFTANDVSVTGGTISSFSGSGTIYTATFTPTVGYSGTATIDVLAGSYNSLSGLANLKAVQATILVDTVAPTVTNVTATPTTGNYKAGAVVPITVVFSEAVIVTGVPTLKLETGTVDQTATYLSGSGTAALVFNYTVAAGDTSADLNYFDTAALVKPSGSAITDAALNIALLTLPSTAAGTAGNLATNAAIVIDTLAPNTPTALTLTPVGGTLVANTLNSTNTNLTASATITAATATGGSADLLIGTTVVATDTTIAVSDVSVTFDLGVTSTAALQAAITSGGLATVRVTDAAGNGSTASTAVTLIVDYSKPSVTAFTGLATTVSTAQNITITTSETVTGFAAADIVASCGGTGTLTGSGTSYTFAWTPPAAFTGSCTFTIAGGNFTDAAGNASNAFANSTVVDNVAPTVTGVTSVSPNGTYIVGQTIDVSVNFSEPVIVGTGVPTLAIRSTPAGSANAVYVSGSATNKLTFRYTISVGDNSSDLNYFATTSLALPTGVTIMDAAGNNANLTLPAVTAGTAGNLATNAALVVDALAPSAPAAPVVTLVGGTVVASYVNSTNTNITASVSGLIAGDVSGGKAELFYTPNGGSAAVVAADTTVSATDTTATFDLGVTSNSALQNLISSAGNGTGVFSVRLTDVSGNVSALGTSTAAFTIDYVKPTIAISSAATGTLNASQTSAITFTASESTSNFATGDATANLGTLGPVSAIIGGAPNRYTAVFTPNASGTWSVSVAAATFTDAAGNPNMLAAPATGLADVTPATATRVAAVDGLYKLGDNIDITVTFSEAVNVPNTRTVNLSNSRTATYLSGTGTTAIIFRYAVQAGDQVIDLNYAANGAWSGTGNVTDLAGNISAITLPPSTGADALAGSSNVNVDALAPTAPTSPTFTITGSSVPNTLNRSSVNLSITSTWGIADSSLSQAEFLLNGTVIGTVNISSPATATSAVLNMNTATAAALQAAVPIGGSVTVRLVDIAGNTATSTGNTLTVDFAALSLVVSLQIGTIITGQTRVISFTLSEAAAAGTFTSGDIVVTNGTISNFAGSGTSYSATFTPTANFTGTTSVSVAAGAMTDVAGNSSTAATSIIANIDTLAPTATLAASAANSSTNEITFSVTGNEGLDCSSLATGAGIDFSVSNGALVSIDQTTSLICTLHITANATRGSPKTVTVTSASTFAISDANGNEKTNLTASPASTVVTLPGNAPSAPSSVSAAPAPAQAQVTWVAPADFGGDATVTYTIQKTSVVNPADTDWVTLTSSTAAIIGTSATITSLTNGNSYFFRVRAANTIGSGAWSISSGSVVPFDVPSAPTITVTSGSSKLDISITAPANNGSAITAYQYSLDGGVTWVAFSNTAANQSISSLVNGTTYNVKVRALNAAGAGTASSSAPVTPFGPASAPIITSITNLNASLIISFTPPTDNGGSALLNYKVSTDGGTTFTALTTPSTSSPITISNLVNGTTYPVKILAVTAISDGTASNSISATPMTTPSAPTAMVGTSGNSSASVTFTAGANGGAPITGYEFAIASAGTSAFGNWTSATATASPILISGLTNGSSYDVRVRAVNGVGAGPFETILAVQAGAKPSAPQIGVVTGASGSITMPFAVNDYGSAISAYQFEIRENPTACAGTYDPTAATGTAWSAWTSFTPINSSLVLTGLTNGTCYEVSIRATNAIGTGDPSRSSGKPISNPAAPVIDSVSIGNTTLSVVFTSTTDNGGLPVVDYEYRVNAGVWVSAGLNSPFTISGLTNGTAYTVELRTKTEETANTVYRYSDVSNAITRTPATVPAQIVIGQIAPGNGFIDLGIYDPSVVANNGGSTITAIRFSLDSGATWTNATWTTGATTVRVGGLANSTSSGYTIQLRAVNAIGTSVSSVSTASIAVGLVPEAPTILATASDSKISLSYTPGNDGGLAITGYRYSIDGGTTWVSVTANPMLLTGLTNGTAYTIQMQAINAKGNSISAIATATPAGAAAAPSISVSSNGSTTSTISFTAPANTGGTGVSLTGYEISLNGGLTWQAATISSGTLASGTVNLTGLTNGVSYSVKLRAINVFGAGAASTGVSALPVASAPAAPTITVSSGRNTISVTLNQGNDGGSPIGSYEYSIDAGTTWVVSTWTPGAPLNFSILGLTNGTSYTVLVRAVNSIGNSATSNAVSAIPSGAAAAMTTLSGYTASAGQAKPSLVDFTDAGVSGVTSANLNAIDSILASLALGARDTVVEIQAIVNAFNKLMTLANGTNDVNTTNAPQNLTPAEWLLIGVNFSADQALLANDFADEFFSTNFDTAAKLTAFATAVAHVIPISSALTLADANTLGLTTITSANIDDLQALIAAQTSVSAVDTKNEINALAATAVIASLQADALAIIAGYTGSNTAPTIADFAAAGIIGVDATNLAAILELLGPAASTATDSAAEVQQFVDAINKLRTAANGVSTSAGTLNTTDFASLGLISIDTVIEQSLFNQIIAGDGFTAVDSLAERAAMVAVIDKLLALASVTPPAALPNPTLTIVDLNALGLTGVTAENLTAVLAALAATANDGSGVDTLAKLQSIASAAIAAQGATTAISGYTSVSGQAAPTLANFAAAGVTGATTANLAMLNAYLSSLPSASRDSAAEIQAIVDAVNHIIAQANGFTDNGTFITAVDLAALGILTTPATSSAEVSLLNAALDAMAIIAVDTQAEFANLARITSAIAAIAAGGTANPVLTPADFTAIGLSGVNSTNITALLNQINASADNATGVDSLAELSALLASANLVSARDNAIAELINYTGLGIQTLPSSSVYSDAGVTGVSSLNLSAIDSLIAVAPSAAKDTTAEIQAIVDAYAKVVALANGTAGGTAAGSLNALEFAALGLSVIDSPAELNLMNAYLDTSVSSAVDSAAELSALASAVAKLAATASVTPPGALPAPDLTLADLALLGINGVTADNLATIIAFIANSANDGSGVASKAALQGLVDAGASQALKDAAATAISLYDGTGIAPSRNQYLDAGVVGVDLTNRDTVNSIVAQLTPAQSDTTAELQAVVDAVSKIRLAADGTAGNSSSSALNATDMSAIGLIGINTSAELALFNAILDQSQISSVDSASELAEIARIVQAIMATAAGLSPTPELTAADFVLIGITGVDASNLSATLALISATSDNGSGVDSIAKLAAIQTAGQAAAAIAQAVDVISNYDGTNQTPVVGTYSTAGVTGVTSANISAVNAFLAPFTAAQSDTSAEVQALVDAVNKLAALADSTAAAGSSLTSADLLALGVQDLSDTASAEKLALLNSVLDVQAFANVSSPADLSNLIDIVNRVINSALGQIVVPEISATDLAALGLNGVTASPNGGNLSVVLAAITGSIPADINSMDKLSALVASTISEFNTYPSLKTIIDYAENNANPAPVISDYTAIPGAGTSLVDASTIEAVNAIIDAQLASGVSSVAKISQLLYDFFFALGKIVDYARDAVNSSAPTISDYQAAGLRNINANSVAAMNAVIAGLTATDVDTPAKLQAILDRLLAATNTGSPSSGSPLNSGTVSKITLIEGTSGPILKWNGAASVTVEIISSSGTVKSIVLNGQNQTGIDLNTLEPGRAYAILVSPTGSTNPGDSQKVAYEVPPAAPAKTEIVPVAANSLQLNWTQSGYAKQYVVVATPVNGKAITVTTATPNVKLSIIAGRKYEVTVTAIGEGDKRSSSVIADVNLPGAISTVVATPVAGKKQTLVSWTPLLVKANATYLVKVDGKLVCTSKLTSCAVPQSLSSRQDVVVSVVGGPTTAVDIVDSKLEFTDNVSFVPNTKLLAPGAILEIRSAATKLLAAKFTTVVVTGHANPVNGIPLKISTQLANERALVIVQQLKKLMPGVKIIAVGRSVFSPAKAGATQSLGNIRAEIYGTK